MTKMEIAALLALGSALCVAFGDVLQQRATHRMTDEIARLAANCSAKLCAIRRWRWGALIIVVSIALQAAAPGPGFGAAGAGVARPFAAVRAADQRVVGPPRGDRPGMGLGRAADGGGDRDRHGRQPAARPFACVASDLGRRGGGAGAAADRVRRGRADLRIWGGALAAVLFAFVSGSLWGVFAVLTKGAVHLLGEGGWALVRNPSCMPGCWSASGGFAWEQAAFRAGALTASMPTLEISQPVVAALLGVVVLGETLNTGRAGMIAIVAAALLMTAAPRSSSPASTPSPRTIGSTRNSTVTRSSRTGVVRRVDSESIPAVVSSQFAGYRRSPVAWLRTMVLLVLP